MSSVTVAYIITIAVSVVIAFFLAYFARQSSAAKALEEKKRREQELIPGAEDELKGAIYEEVASYVDSEHKGKKISEKIAQIVEREVQNKVNINAQELTRKYEGIIQEKTQNEEVTWKKYKKVLAEHRQTEAVVRSIAEGLVVVDASGKVVMMNPAAEKLLGVSQNEKFGKPVSDGMKEEQLVSFAKASGAGVEDREIELISKQNETKKILRASSAVIENEKGETVGMVSVLSDITKQKELDKLKANFVANVTHELRTPLVAVEKSIALVLNKEAGPLTSTQEQFIAMADRNIKRLTLLINDLLDLAKLESGKIELKPQANDIDKVIGDAVETLKTWANTRSIKIEKKVGAELPVVNIDANRIIQVFTNLIGNAIKFTPDGGLITVKAALQDNAKAMQLSVEDTGIGIEKENIPKIFSKFYQVGERISTDVSGTGIGLSICKEIVELHSGKIWVESEKGAGTKFIFTLPV